MKSAIAPLFIDLGAMLVTSVQVRSGADDSGCSMASAWPDQSINFLVGARPPRDQSDRCILTRSCAPVYAVSKLVENPVVCSEQLGGNDVCLYLP
ncbi:hypothetical protein PoB_004233700 [Plakobranchus ocellatus]|uniref:Secreted protein n=1 Tax=Plakobranchus ocellatus TaxID=259542 RepID=A0AAV4B8N1_9GAST|nr:hypothetical protein PoB_004233700 [Plakobranchus ocellatus]